MLILARVRTLSFTSSGQEVQVAMIPGPFAYFNVGLVEVANWRDSPELICLLLGYSGSYGLLKRTTRFGTCSLTSYRTYTAMFCGLRSVSELFGVTGSVEEAEKR